MTATDPNRAVDGAGLAAFRFGFGALMVVSTLRFVANGWIESLYLAPGYHFTYLGFDWVKPWPGWGMYFHYALMGGAALTLCIGLFTRLSALVFFLTFTYAELIDKTTYLNHYYLVSLLALLLVILPSNSVASVDAWRTSRAGREPALSAEVAVWCYWVLRAQVAVVYLFAACGKVNADWVLEAEPLRTWLLARADLPLVGPSLATPAAAYAMSWAGLVFDFAIVPLLAWRRTRGVAYVGAVLFHSTIWLLFPVGVFSWVMLLAATVFFDPAWPRRFLPAARGGVPAWAPTPGFWPKLVVGVHLAVQALVPLRFVLYPGDTNWTEEAFRFAWRVMLVEKSGSVEYRVRRAAGQPEELVRPRQLLTPLQYKLLSTAPDMIHQYAIELGQRYGSTKQAAAVRADAWVALNGRPSQRIVDPNVDLARQPRSLTPKHWIVPLAQPPHDPRLVQR
jgi:vitamin K-dependent gamma-carboxylase